MLYTESSRMFSFSFSFLLLIFFLSLPLSLLPFFCVLHVCERVYVHSAFVELRGQPWVLVFAFYLVRDKLSLVFAVYAGLAGLRASGESLSPPPISLQRHWDCICLHYTSFLYIDSGYLNSGPQACVASTFTHSAISLALLIWFRST